MALRMTGLPASRRDYPVRVVRVDDHPDYPVHRAPFWEIVLVTGGTALHRIGHSSHPLQAGDLFVVNDRDRHGYASARGLRLFNVLFDPRRLGMAKWEIASAPGFRALFHERPVVTPQQAARARFHLAAGTFRNTVALIEELDRCARERGAGWRMLVEGHFRHLVVLLSRVHDARLRDHDEALERMTGAIAALECGFREEVDWKRLIGAGGMSERTFYRLFQRATGRTPRAYLIDLRLQHACGLLRKTGQPVTQIAYASGFTDGNYFTREFRQVIGETPSAYRKRWAD